jgi:tRNA(Ile)-lysidine synthase
MDILVKKIYEDMKSSGMLQGGEHLVMGVSGGADSMCLLYVLLALAPVMDLRLTVVHIHHGLRGEAADGDRAFVEKTCASEGIPCRSFQTDIRKMAESQHLSEEEAGRMYRYQCFEQIRAEVGADRIAVAHHMEDTAETVLMNLFRGSGLKGLSGIPAVRGEIIRPLIHISRSEIEAYLSRNDISFRTDATNFETGYTRNRIRLDLMPYIKDNINQAAVSHIAETAMLAADISRYMEQQAQKVLREIAVFQADGLSCEMNASGWDKLDIALRREVLRQVILQVTGQMKDIGAVHIEAVNQLFFKAVGRRIILPYGICAVKTYHSVRIERTGQALTSHKPADVRQIQQTEPLQIPGLYPVGEDGREVALSLFSMDKNKQIPKNLYTKWFDYDKIKNGLVLRYRQNGDYLVIRGGFKKALRRILVDEKIPQSCRDSMILLAEGNHILWIPDMGRISEYYKVTEATRRILSAELKENEDEGKN